MSEEGNSGCNPDAQDFVPYIHQAPSKLKHETLDTPFPGNFGDLNLVTPSGIFCFKAGDKKWVSHSKVLVSGILPVLKYSSAVMTGPDTFVLSGGLYPSVRDITPLAQTKRITISLSWGNRVESVADLPDMLEARYMHSSVYFQGKVIVIGGQTNTDNILSTCEVLNGSTWTSLPSLHIPRTCASAIVHNDSIYVVGGFSGRGELAPGLEVYIGDSWLILKDDAFLGAAVGLSATPRNSLLIVGGSDGEVTKDSIVEFLCESTELVTRSQGLRMPRARSLCCAGGWVFYGGWGEAEQIDESSLTAFENPMTIESYDTLVYPSFTKASA